MSKELTAAKRYAKALYEAAKEQDLVERTIKEMRWAASVMEHNPDLGLVLTHPNIDTSAKTGLIQNIFGANLSAIVVNTIVLLVERKRADSIVAVSEQLVRIAGEALGRTEATVYSPQALTDKEAADIAAAFSGLTGKAISVSNIIDASLLGGIKVRIGDKLYDGSLSNKLKRIEKALQATQAL
ncbi:MAG: synthase subunit delta [Paenibacillaceae bacterium]|jgi:F-type H+-transporting ATPase subunit delta|nr:synthase subunit delta [Paenibacillaceae bacterium]